MASGSSLGSSACSGGHVHHHAKFRWTENLTCRFIQLRKEHGKMFTGRKYSAQAGWEYILRQMREEFPTIMADVHYRVLKKKWSNLLQQYKELKNPVHGDKNRADDISWPFYAAIDQVLGGVAPPSLRARRASSNNDPDEVDLEEDEDLNPQEFLCVSVAPDEDEEEEEEEAAERPERRHLDRAGINSHYESSNDADRPAGLPRLQPFGRGEPVFDVSASVAGSTRLPRKRGAPTADEGRELLSRLPRATELTIRPIARDEGRPTAFTASTASTAPSLIGNGGRKRAREEPAQPEDSAPAETRLERRLAEFLDYAKRRDEENRSILVRMLEALEDIRNAIG